MRQGAGNVSVKSRAASIFQRFIEKFSTCKNFIYFYLVALKDKFLNIKTGMLPPATRHKSTAVHVMAL